MEMILEKQFREIVETELKDQGLTRADLARRMKVSPQYVTNYLNGSDNPGTLVIERFLKALGKQPRLEIDDVRHKEKSVAAT